MALAPVEPAPTAAAAAVIGPDMTQLWQRFPPRASAPSWPATEQAREALLARLLAAPFTVDEDRAARARRRLGLVRLLDWLAEHPGDTWQQRWLVSGADAMGNADWWRPLLAWARPRNPRAGVSTSSNLRVCALLLIGADVIRPSLDWVLTPRAPQNLVAVMARARDPHGFAELAALCAASPAGRTMKAAALRRAATILAVKGGTLREITVGDCLELSLAIDGRSLRTNRGMGFYQLLHEMGVFGPHAPSTIRAFGTRGQLSPAQLIDRYAITCRPIRDVLVAYLTERQPMLDHTTLINLACSLGGLFWRDLERHHPGIASLAPRPGGRRRLETACADQDPPGRRARRADQRGPGTTRRWPAQPRRRPRVLPRHRPVGDGRPAPVGAVGGPVPDPRRGPGPAEGDPRPQVADGSADPGTAPGPAPARVPGQRRTHHRGRHRDGRAGHTPGGSFTGRRRHAAPRPDLQRRHRTDLGRGPRHR